MASDNTTATIVITCVSITIVLVLVGGLTYLCLVRRDSKAAKKKLMKEKQHQSDSYLQEEKQAAESLKERNDQVLLKASKLQAIQVQGDKHSDPLYEDPAPIKSNNFETFVGPSHPSDAEKGQHIKLPYPLNPQTEDDNYPKSSHDKFRDDYFMGLSTNSDRWDKRDGPSLNRGDDKIYWFGRISNPPSYNVKRGPSDLERNNSEYALKVTPPIYASPNYVNKRQGPRNVPPRVYAQKETYPINRIPREQRPQSLSENYPKDHHHPTSKNLSRDHHLQRQHLPSRHPTNEKPPQHYPSENIPREYLPTRYSMRDSLPYNSPRENYPRQHFAIRSTSTRLERY